jgi:hypothetical protein
MHHHQEPESEETATDGATRDALDVPVQNEPPGSGPERATYRAKPDRHRQLPHRWRKLFPEKALWPDQPRDGPEAKNSSKDLHFDPFTIQQKRA